MLLLDGLNEVPPEFQMQIGDCLRSLLAYSHHILISCRERDYDKSLRQDTATFALEPPDEAQIADYLGP